MRDNSESASAVLRVFFLILYELIAEIMILIDVLNDSSLRSDPGTRAQVFELIVECKSLRQQINKGGTVYIC